VAVSVAGAIAFAVYLLAIAGLAALILWDVLRSLLAPLGAL
jgi:hypothetical protein